MKFSIRDLLLVTVIVDLAVGWWLEHLAKSRLETEYHKTVWELGNEINEMSRAKP